MIFHLEIMENIKKIFCENLKKWQASHFKGTRTELGEKFKVSQGYISNVLAGRRCGDETWRRMVAKEICMDYNTMIGVKENGAKNIINFENIEDEEHFRITKKFQDKSRAIEINRWLVEIESYDSDELEEFKDMIQAKLKRLRKKHKNQENSGKAVSGEANRH